MSWRGRRRWLRVSKVYESTSSRPHLLWETAAGVWTETDPAAGSVCFNVIFSAASESHSVHCMQRARRVHHLLPFFVLFSIFVCENWAETDVKTVSWCVQWHLVCKCPHSSQNYKTYNDKKTLKYRKVSPWNASGGGLLTWMIYKDYKTEWRSWRCFCKTINKQIPSFN